jgi:hypothetical protein
MGGDVCMHVLWAEAVVGCFRFAFMRGHACVCVLLCAARRAHGTVPSKCQRRGRGGGGAGVIRSGCECGYGMTRCV